MTITNNTYSDSLSDSNYSSINKEFENKDCSTCEKQWFLLSNWTITKIKDCTSCSVGFINDYWNIITTAKEKTSNLFYENLSAACWQKCDIVNNKWCTSECNSFYSQADKILKNIATQNSDQLYKELSQCFYRLSDKKLKINFYNSTEKIKDEILNFFDWFFDWDIQDINKVIYSYEFMNKFIAMNHWDLIEWEDLYEISAIIVWKLKYFYDFIMPDFHKDVYWEWWYTDEDFNRILSLVWKLPITNSHLKKLDFENSYEAIEDFNFILNSQFIWFEQFCDSDKWNKDILKTAETVFLINYWYVYTNFLNFLDKEALSFDLIETNYFNFKEKDSIEDRKKHIFKRFLWLSEQFLKERDLKIFCNCINDVLIWFMEISEDGWYNSVMSLEVIHHLLSLFSKENKDFFLIKEFINKLVLNENELNHGYNSMKLRTLNLILKRMNSRKIDKDEVLDVLSKVSKNFDQFWSKMISNYARITLPMAWIYSNFYKNNIEKINKIKKENNDLTNDILDRWISIEKKVEIKNKIDNNIHKQDMLESDVEFLREKSINLLSFYSTLFDWDLTRDDYENVVSNILSNLFKNDIENDIFDLFWKNFNIKFSEIDYNWALDKKFQEYNDAYFNKKEKEVEDSIAKINSDVLDNKFDNNSVNKVLSKISQIFFKNICQISIEKEDSLVSDDKFYKKIIKLDNWYVINFDVNRKFIKLFDEIFNDLFIKKEFDLFCSLDKKEKLLNKIQNTLIKYVDRVEKFYKNEITWIDNYRVLENDLENFKWEWTIILLEFNNFWDPSSVEDIESKKIIEEIINKNANIYKNILKNNWGYNIYHIWDNKKFALLFKWADKEFYKESVEKEIRNNDYLFLQNVNIWSYSWLINKTSLSKCVWGNVKSSSKFDKKVFQEIVDIQNNPEREKDVKIYVQPIVNMEWEVYKYEALTRVFWKDWKIIYPDNYFPMLEKWSNAYYNSTSKLIKNWFKLVEESWINLSLNISTQDLALHWDKIKAETLDLVNKYWKDIAWKITYELLEDDYFNDSIYWKMKYLKDLWIKFAIDDFWAWNSSYDRLVKFAWLIDYIKIDRVLIENLTNKDWEINLANFKVVESIINMTHKLWAKSVCEYVEKEWDVKALKLAWCDFMQWWYFWKAFDSANLERK